MVDWYSLVKDLGIFSIAGALIAYLIKTFFEKSMDKDIERFKNDLHQETIRFSKLHEKRAIVIRDLYNKLVEFELNMINLTSYVQPDNEEEQRKIFEKAKKAAIDYEDFQKKNRIFFKKEVCKILDDIDSKGREAWVKWHLSQREEHYPQQIDNWTQAYETVSDKVPKLREKLENEFREILGVEENR